MAIDTEDKRRSVQAYSTGGMRPGADGTIDEGDRACAAWLYLGLDYDNPVAPTGAVSWFRNFRGFILSTFKGGFH